MRFAVYGAGAIGGLVGARLSQAGHAVTLIARGRQLEAIRARGLEVRSPGGTAVVELAAVSHPRGAGLRRGDVVLLAMKTQDTAAAVGELAACAPEGVAIACLQNGVENERLALRAFPDVYGVMVVCPAAHLEPGVVEAHAGPVEGLFEVGRHPSGADGTAEAIAEALRSAGFTATARADVRRWKYGKLVANLANAVEAVCGPGAAGGELVRRAREEGRECLRAAGIDAVSGDEVAARQAALNTAGRAGGSSWQSLERRAGSIETDYLNGEIVLLGRLHGVPTPVNAALQRLAARLARDELAPGSVPVEEVLAQIS